MKEITLKQVMNIATKSVAWLEESLGQLGVPQGIQTVLSVSVQAGFVGDDHRPGMRSEVVWLGWHGPADGDGPPRVTVTREFYDAPVCVGADSLVYDCDTGEQCKPVRTLTLAWADADGLAKLETGFAAWRLALACWHCLHDGLADCPPSDGDAKREEALLHVAKELARIGLASRQWKLSREPKTPRRDRACSDEFMREATQPRGAC